MILLYLALFGVFLSLLFKIGSLVRQRDKTADSKFLTYLQDIKKLQDEQGITVMCNDCDGHGYTLDDYSNATISDYKVMPCDRCMSTGYLIRTDLFNRYINKQIEGEA